LLLFGYGLYRTYAGASSARDALIRVDIVFIVSFSNAVNRTFRFASSATNAIFSYNVSHFFLLKFGRDQRAPKPPQRRRHFLYDCISNKSKNQYLKNKKGI
jgi:hypothetical protein